MNYSQPSIIIPQNTTSVEDFCNDGMTCVSLSEFTQNASNTFPMYEASVHPTQENLQLNDNQTYDMAQGFINPYVTIESQSMSGLSTIPTQQQLQLNGSCVIHDSYRNATFLSATVPPTIDPLHQDTLPPSVSHHTYISSYPSYNTLEVVRAQLNALQNSNTNQTQETSSRETNLSSSVTRDEVDPVDKYIDWAKVEESSIGLDPVEVLKALGFGSYGLNDINILQSAPSLVRYGGWRWTKAISNGRRTGSLERVLGTGSLSSLSTFYQIEDPILSVLSPIQSPTKPSLRSLEFQLGSSSTADPIIPPPNEIVIVISGPSGVCIDAVINKLRQVREELKTSVVDVELILECNYNV
ncbi:hypothetical protein ISN45_Aa03g030230 [Arabidopsis thaliana x Arabidopsis arenosa]|uniref:Uncharacterized protein n=1 Tax=Arabidopsis thaliana x Arabidopsis arenosa TaxID=1240361 RepID=A0A8T2AX73_9BRAS|nr:hypothetical protein ISN45_Aa03g030230 [Arabidopsis thaliana x Arabidopsis arenosa]